MLDLTTIILTYNEELHIRRCLENVRTFSKRVIVVDCHSSDSTADIAISMGAEVIEHDWPGNQADQFNWALDNIPIDTEWILRLDADEYATKELIGEMEAKLPKLSDDVTAIVLPLGRAFQGRILRHGIVNGIKMIRLFRTGCARYDSRVMDEKFVVLKGSSETFSGKFIDDNRSSLAQFIEKHNSYSSREAALLLDTEYHLTKEDYSRDTDDSYSCEEVKKRQDKAKYSKLPLFWRSFAYYLYRRYIKLGILDGKEGFLWDFFQGLWYRMLVDSKVYMARKTCGKDKDKLRTYIKDQLGVSL